jgi:uncharacterized FlgJ-related protein
MKQQIYQNGFWLMAGLIFGVILTLLLKPNNKEIVQPQIKVEITKDTIITKKVVALNEHNLKKELIKNNIPHANIVLAQAKLETGNFKSKLVRSHQNIFGMRKGNKYKRYSHWSECVEDYATYISSRYKSGSYYTFLQKINYAEDEQYIQKLKQLETL